MPMKTAILCRTNAPLVKCAFDLIRRGRGVKVRIVGRDIAKALKDVIGEVLDYRLNAPIREFLVLLDGWINHIREKCINDDSKDAYLADCEDQYGCIQAIASQSTDAKDLCRVIDTYFCDSESLDDDPMTVVLASGHRSKGLEWERVIWIRPDLCPHPAAETAADKQQEEHLYYILPTRAQEQLIICHDKNPA
jgi:hypothetical protein